MRSLRPYSLRSVKAYVEAHRNCRDTMVQDIVRRAARVKRWVRSTLQDSSPWSDQWSSDEWKRWPMQGYEQREAEFWAFAWQTNLDVSDEGYWQLPADLRELIYLSAAEAHIWSPDEMHSFLWCCWPVLTWIDTSSVSDAELALPAPSALDLVALHADLTSRSFRHETNGAEVYGVSRDGVEL